MTPTDVAIPEEPEKSENMSDFKSGDATTPSVHLYADGASRGNPGDAGIGVVIRIPSAAGEERDVTVEEPIGKATNNEAEYKALIRGLEECRRLGLGCVRAHLDSELVVRQLNGRYRVKDRKLLPLYIRAKELLESFRRIEIVHIRREENKIANNLAQNAARRAECSPPVVDGAREQAGPDNTSDTQCSPSQTAARRSPAADS